jgi:hypothetical protein
MKLIGKSVLVMMLGVLVLASAASANYVSSVGGASSKSTNGAGVGTSSGIIQYDDSGSSLNPLNGLTTGKLSDVLTETITASASVPSGSIGDATAGFTTNSAQTTKQPLSFSTGAYISTTLDGAVSAAVYKTSLGGSADATATMVAQSGASDTSYALGGTASLQAVANMNQALGNVLAEAKGTASHASGLGTTVPLPSYQGFSEGYASGDAKVYGSNDASQASGTISAMSKNYAGTFFNPTKNVGEGINYENIHLIADRGPSFNGDSEAAAYLNNGTESGETDITVPGIGSTIIDNEASSTMNANASALNARDLGSVNLNVLSETGTDGTDATADSILSGTSTVNRDIMGSSQKAVGQGFISYANWIASTTVPNTLVPPVSNAKTASVSGSTGVIQDGMGKPTSMKGVGVGSWIMNPAIAAQSATAYQLQLSTSNPATLAAQIPGSYFTASPFNIYSDPNIALDAGNLVLSAAAGTATVNQEQYKMILNGRPVTGVTNDAVGAYLGVGVQRLNTVDMTQLPAARSFTKTPASRNGIEWLEGTNPSPLPGHYSNNVIPNGLTQTATSRTSGLIGI